MKIFYVVPGYYPQFASPYEYSRKIREAGAGVSVIAAGRPGEAIEEELDGVRVRRIPRTHDSSFVRSLLRNFRFAIAALRLIRREECDLVHVFFFRGSSLMPVLAARHTRTRWLADLRSLSISRTRWVSWLNDRISQIEGYFFHYLAAFDPSGGAQVWGKRAPFFLFQPGADLERFKPGKPEKGMRSTIGIPSDSLLAVFSGSLHPSRQPAVLLDAFEIASSRYQNLSMLVVGGGESLDLLRQRAKHLNSRTVHVYFTGPVPYSDVQEYLACADISLAYVPIIRQYNAAPPLKTIESLACGLATIATRTLGNSRFIEDGVNGLLVDDDPEAIAGAIVKLATDEELRRRLAENARPSVSRFDWKVIVQTQLLPAYWKILHPGREDK